jgi:hypothetical protein
VTILATIAIVAVKLRSVSRATFKPRHVIEWPTMAGDVLYASRPHIGEPRIISLTEVHHMGIVMTELIGLCIEKLDLASAAEMSQCKFHRTQFKSWRSARHVREGARRKASPSHSCSSCCSLPRVDLVPSKAIKDLMDLLKKTVPGLLDQMGQTVLRLKSRPRRGVKILNVQ